MQIKIGDKIRELRHRDGRKQDDLANALGVTAQAVSRWEANGGYPDMEMIPAIANYFNISIDELFGYSKDREDKLKNILIKADEALNEQGDMTECVEMLRSAAYEFPSEPNILVKLGYALSMQGWKKHGARSYTTNDSDYAYEDTEYNSNNEYWQEEVRVFEKALTMDITPEDRNTVILMLVDVYAKMGYNDKAKSLANRQSSIAVSRELLLPNATKAEERDKYQGEAIITLLNELKQVLVDSVCTKISIFTTPLAAKLMIDLAHLYESIFSDGRCGATHYDIGRLYLLAATFEARHGDGTDTALEYFHKGFEHIKSLKSIGNTGEYVYTSPLVSKATSTSTSLSDTFWKGQITVLPDNLLSRIKDDPQYAECFL